MEKIEHELTRDNWGYIKAQLERINSSLASHQQQLNRWQELGLTIGRNCKKIAELEHKIISIETYQSQNFKNNQRLFNSHAKLDIVEKKLLRLEQTQFAIIGSPFQNQLNQEQLLLKIQTRFRQIEQQLQKTKYKSQSLVKFRKEMPPKLPNSQSTHDMSVDQGKIRNQLKNMEKKLHESLAQKFGIFEKRFAEKFQREKLQNSIDLEVFSQNRFNRQTRVKIKTDIPTQIKKKDGINFQQESRRHYDSYYNEDFQKISRVKTQRKKDAEQRQPVKPKIKPKQKKEKAKSKSLSEERSMKKLKASQLSNFKKETTLSSVNQYLRIRQKAK